MKTAPPKPYDYFPAMMRLRESAHSLPDDECRRLKATVALNASDSEAVSLLVDLAGDDWAHIYPDLPKPKPVTTDKAIDTFLDTYGKPSPGEEELLERLIFNPVPADYSSVLEQQESDAGAKTEPADMAGSKSEGGASHLSILAESINRPAPAKEPAKPLEPVTSKESSKPVETVSSKEPSKPVEPAPKKEPQVRKEQPATARKTDTPKPQQQGTLSLELAKIFVKQGHFSRAHEIISKIILNNPEKSVYFADQLRFLEKLMKIEKLRKG